VTPGLVGIALATLISEDATCIGVGLLAARGELDFASGVAACFAGIVLGDALLFAAGRFAGRPALRRAPLAWWVRAGAVERAAGWLEARGPQVVLFSRFMPGLRLPTYVAAGMLGMRFGRFLGLFLLAAALWTPLLVSLSMFAGRLGEPWLEAHRACLIPATLALALGLFAAVRIGLALATWRGRRLLLGRWRRLRNWEYWPLQVVYLPVALHIARLGLRHGSPTLFTAANPAMPASGFIGESKSAILAALDDGSGDVAPFRVIPGQLDVEGRLKFAEQELAALGPLPVVIKPDRGERGSHVHIARSPEQLERALRDQPGDAILQRYVPGLEYGLYYARHPDAERGSLLGITFKQLPTVVGDGASTLEQLILADARAICMVRAYFERHAGLLDTVPAAGETIELVPIGTHSRGAIFLDASHAITPELEASVERISRRCAGFHLGRYDVRTPSLDELRAGRFSVLELNGVTSEPTHVYDPRHGVFAGLREISQHWTRAFVFGDANRARGAAVSTAGELLREWMRARGWL